MPFLMMLPGAEFWQFQAWHHCINTCRVQALHVVCHNACAGLQKALQSDTSGTKTHKDRTNQQAVQRKMMKHVGIEWSTLGQIELDLWFPQCLWYDEPLRSPKPAKTQASGFNSIFIIQRCFLGENRKQFAGFMFIVFRCKTGKHEATYWARHLLDYMLQVLLHLQET